jgi:hypothetical protein
MTGCVPTFRERPLPLGEGGAQRRVREARPTIAILRTIKIVGRVALIRRCRATFSQREKDSSHSFKTGGHRPPLQAAFQNSNT